MKTNCTLILAALLSAGSFAQDATAPATNAPAAKAPATKDGEIRMNFRNAPLELVLNHMSEAAGFIINVAPGTTVSGKVDVWSNSPLTKEEAVTLLNKVLKQNNLAAIREDRTLTIVNQSAAKTWDVPVKKGADPELIAKSDEVVTQIIPVKFANAAALIQNLQPLLPEYAQNGLSANESGNAILLTATQTDIRRMAEIIEALDTSISSVSSIKVFPLKYADAKALVDAVKELFTPPQQQQQGFGGRGGGGQFFQQMFGGGGPGGFPGGPGGFGGPGGGRGNFGNNTGARGNTSQTAARVVAVADERSNSLIVAAAEDSIPTIEKLVKEIDVPVDDITELRVFPLVNSNPQEMADLLGELFPDDTTQGSNQQFQFRGGRGGFGGFGGGFGGFNRGGQNQSSERSKKKGKVIAVAEQRTSSIIVSAASELMPQIEAMIRQIDASKRGKQKVYVYSLENADAAQVGQVLQEMFDRNNNGRNNNQNQSMLQSRTQQAIQQQGQQQQIGQGFGGGQGNQGGFGR